MSQSDRQQSTPGCPPAACPSCEPQTPLRNHYFFGKLMDVPDFDVEQQYLVEKFKRHHQRLHGTGVICGLEVVAHANPACRDRYLMIRPGAALDCCGNEILVLNEEVLDLHGFPEMLKIIEAAADDDVADHELRFCIRYRECPTEEVPVLFDECGCDDTRCAPNRILETYAFDVRVNAPLPDPAVPVAPALEWTGTLALPKTKAVLVHAGSERIYASADLVSGGIVQQFHLHTGAPIAPKTFFNHPVLALAANADGSRLFVAVAGAGAADPATLEVLDTSMAAFSGPSLFSIPIADSAGAKVSLLLLPSGELASLASTAAKSVVQLWDLGAAPAAIAARKAEVNAALIGPELAGDDTTLYAAEAANTVHRFDTTVANLNPQPISITGASDLIAIEVVKSTAPDLIAWIEGTGKHLKLAKADGTLLGTMVLPAPPVALIIAPGGRLAYVLMQPATGPARVAGVNLHRFLADPTHPEPALGPSLPIGNGGVALDLGTRLYAAYDDGIAVIAIHDADCGDFLKRHACPGCETEDCVILATVQGWRPGRRLENPTVPPSDPLADAAAGVARIDNDLGRVVVSSTADLAKAVACILDHGVGGGMGEQGPPGKDGKDGVDGKDGKDGADGKNGVDGKDGIDGKDGVGLDWNLPHICDFNWTQSQQINLNRSESLELLVAFDTDMFNADLNLETIWVRIGRFREDQNVPLWCWCDLDLDDRIAGGRLVRPCNTNSAFQRGQDSQGLVNAVRIRLPNNLSNLAGEQRDLRIRIIIKGDFIRGVHRTTGELRALDGNHLPKLKDPSPPGPPSPGELPVWMRPGDDRYSGDGVEGGTFESWFDIHFNVD